MGDSLPTVWQADPHTLAKHAILRGYLQAWLPILTRRMKGSARVLFVDGFAGPGIYSGGEPGSPVLALRTALEQAGQFPSQVQLLFVEEDPRRFATLKDQLLKFKATLASTPNVVLLEPQNDGCEQVLTRELDHCRTMRIPFGPALVFLDQFGYSAVPMALIGRILLDDMCEVLTYLQWRDLNRFITDQTKWPGITRAFGGDEWKPALSMTGQAREVFLLSMYREMLSQRSKAAYVWHFAMCGENDELLYWLFFATNSPKGLREMKRSMLKVDDSGRFKFSDANDPNQLTLLAADCATDEWLAEHLGRKFDGNIVPVSAIDDYVLRHTPCYKFAESLGLLEREGRAVPTNAPRGRKRGGFAAYPDMCIRFFYTAPVSKPPQGTLF